MPTPQNNEKKREGLCLIFFVWDPDNCPPKVGYWMKNPKRASERTSEGASERGSERASERQNMSDCRLKGAGQAQTLSYIENAFLLGNSDENAFLLGFWEVILPQMRCGQSQTLSY